MLSPKVDPSSDGGVAQLGRRLGPHNGTQRTPKLKNAERGPKNSPEKE